jgi:hypothetical protein
MLDGRVGGWVGTARRRLWRSWFHPRAWEASGRAYEAVGVRWIKELYFGGRYFNALVGAVRRRRYRPFHGPGWPRRWLRFTVVVEAGHLAIGLYMLGTATDALLRGDPLSAARLSAINLLVNIYPVMVQRYNRARLLRILGRTSPPAEA